MKRIRIAITVILAAVALTGCQMNKSIYESLPFDTVIKAEKSHPGFQQMYMNLENLRNVMPREEFGKISYKELYNFLKNQYNNEEFCTKYRNKAIEAHNERFYEPVQERFNSLTQEWDRFMEEHDVDRYIKIRVHTYYTGGHPAWYYTYETPRGKVKSVSATLRIKGRDNDTKHLSLSDLNTYSSKNRYWYYYRYDSSFWRHTTARVSVQKVTLENGTTISSSDMKDVPKPVKEYCNDPSFEKGEEVITALIDPNYQSRGVFVNAAINDALRRKNERCFNFVERSGLFEGGIRKFGF